MPCYYVTERSKVCKGRLVIADSPASALKFVASQQFAVETLTGQSVAELVASGVAVEDARRPQRELALEPPPNTGETTAASGVTFQLPGGETRQMYIHKAGCSADPWTPITGKGCRCTKLDLPPE